MENDQLFPRFPSYVIQLFQTQDLKATTITYLPPIETPINDYGTLFEMFFRSKHLAAQSNMKYTHIVLDCGAAIKAYHVLWNNPDRFKNIVIFTPCKPFWVLLVCTYQDPVLRMLSSNLVFVNQEV